MRNTKSRVNSSTRQPQPKAQTQSTSSQPSIQQFMNWIRKEKGFIPTQILTEKTVELRPISEVSNAQIMRAFNNRNKDVFSWIK